MRQFTTVSDFNTECLIDVVHTRRNLEELAAEVAKKESDSEQPSDAELHRYEVTLHHKELPEAARASFIEYDSENGAVQLTGEPPEFEALLTIAEVVEKPH